MISVSDLNELRRLSTNSYDEEKALVNRIIRGINELHEENKKLRAELKVLYEKEKAKD